MSNVERAIRLDLKLKDVMRMAEVIQEKYEEERHLLYLTMLEDYEHHKILIISQLSRLFQSFDKSEVSKWYSYKKKEFS